MGKKKKKGTRKQGLTSWITSVIGLAIGLSYPIGQALKTGQTWEGFANAMIKGYAGYDTAEESNERYKYLINQGNIPTTVFGPGYGDQVHKPDEFIPIDSMAPSVKVLALIIYDWCK